MAARKKPPAPAQSSLFAFPKLTESPIPVPYEFIPVDPGNSEPKSLPKPENMHGACDGFGGEDPPHARAVVAERKLRIVPAAPAAPSEDVIVEPHGDGRFVVSTLRHHGTTTAAVVYTRAQLEMLLKRIPAALEVGA